MRSGVEPCRSVTMESSSLASHGPWHSIDDHFVPTTRLSMVVGYREEQTVRRGEETIANVSDLSEVPLAVAESSGGCFPSRRQRSSAGYLSCDRTGRPFGAPHSTPSFARSTHKVLLRGVSHYTCKRNRAVQCSRVLRPMNPGF
jgi:hypothetical protein